MTTLYEKNGKRAIFELLIEKNKIIYMSANCTNFMNDKRYIVVVESNKFLTLWQNEENPIDKKLNYGNKSTWRMDKKYDEAEYGFSFGKVNPVPLANIVCAINNKNNLPYIAINDGITRTIWLLTNEVKYFPVECHSFDIAQLLAKHAGFIKEIHTVKELLDC